MNRSKLFKYISVAFAIMMLSALIGCGSASDPAQSAPPSGGTITDGAGRTVALESEPSSIVCLGAGALRMVAYLDSVDLVTGVEADEHEHQVLRVYSHVHRDRLESLPVIGKGGSGGTVPYEEEILGLAPDLVIYAGADASTADALESKVGSPVIVLESVDQPFSPALERNLTALGAALGREARASEVVATLHEYEKDLADRTADIPDDQVKSAYMAGVNFRGAHGFAGTESGFAPFDAVGVVNVADGTGVTGAFDIDIEHVQAADPDHIFVDLGNLSLVEEDVRAKPDVFSSMSAITEGRVHPIVGYRYYSVNVEMAIADAYHVGKTVYPERFEDVEFPAIVDAIAGDLLGTPIAADLHDAGYDWDADVTLPAD